MPNDGFQLKHDRGDETKNFFQNISINDIMFKTGIKETGIRRE
jgi:hypothetical protein